MSSKPLKKLIRILGLAITILLLIQPWLISADSVSPFINSLWAQIIASAISIFASSLLFAFYRPSKPFKLLSSVLIILFIAISVSLYFTHYAVCLRVSLVYIGLLACIGSLRIFRSHQDNISIACMISISGLFMAIYSIFQYFGYDFLDFLNNYKVVGTFTNPNFLGLFLCITSIITLGLGCELYNRDKINSIVFFVFFIIQISIIFILNKIGLYISLLFMILIWFWSDKFTFSGKLSRKSPLICGFLLALLLILTQWSFYYITSNYQWNEINSVPENYKNFVSRIILWQMGFEIFKEHLYTGTGVGSIPYIMPLQRPPTGTILGLELYNDDPHSFIVSLLAETGFLGLWGICSLLVAVFGAFLRKKYRYNPSYNIVDEVGDSNNTIKAFEFPWYHTIVLLVIIILGFKSGFIKSDYLPEGIIITILFFGIMFIFKNIKSNTEKNDYYYLSKGTLTAILTFLFFSSFNNTFSITPLIGLMTVIVGLHFSCSLPNVRFKQKITGISLFFILLPIAFTVATVQLQQSYYNEQKLLIDGYLADSDGDWEKSEQCFLSVINSNHQYLQAYEGLAKSLFNQGLKEKKLGLYENELGSDEKKLGNIEKEQKHLNNAKVHFDKAKIKFDEAQDVLTNIDTMVPNANSVKLKIANILLENNKILEAHRYAVENLEWSRDAISYELLGNILLKEGKLKEAENVFKEGLLNPPSNLLETYAVDRIHLTLAALASDRNDYEECKKQISNITTDVGENIDALYIKGRILVNEKRYEEALSIFEKLIIVYPEVPRILNATGYLLMITSKDLPRAQILLEKAFRILKEDEKQAMQSDLLNISNSLGKLYQKQKNYSKAGEFLKLSYENTPDNQKLLKEERLKDLEDFYKSMNNAE